MSASTTIALLSALAAAPPPADTVHVLDTITVIGSRASAELPLRTRGVQILDRSELSLLPIRSVADALRSSIGVEVGARSPAQTDLSIRGGTFEQLLVLVDGVRMSDPQTGHFDLDLTVPLDRVERIEILRGPASAQYGSDALGGVVNIVTRAATSGVEDRPVGGAARVEGGAFGTLIAAADVSARLSRGAEFMASVERGSSDGHREGTEWEQLLGSVRASLPLGGGRLQGDAGLARRDFGARDFYAPFPSVEETRTETASIRWVPAPGARVRVEPRVSYRSHDDDFTLIRDNPSVYHNVHNSTQIGAELTARTMIAPGVVAAGGAEAARHRLRSNALGDREETRSAVFGELSARIGARGDLSIGLRHDAHERWGGATSPSVAGAVELRPGFRLRASWGRAFRGPSWTERFYADPGHIPNPDVKPERGNAFEVGGHVDIAPGLALSAAGFERRSRDLIDWARPVTPAGADPAPWVPRNVNEARFRGFEFEGRWDASTATRFTLAGSFLSVTTDSEGGFESKYALRPLVEQVVLGVRRALPAGASVSARLQHGRRGGPGASAMDEDPFRDADLRVEFPVRGRGTIHVDLKNLTGSEHPDLTGHPVPGRALYLGVRIGDRR